ncbi:MAG: hypothetical protein ACRD22_03515 [Terriglobia bacterium]
MPDAPTAIATPREVTNTPAQSASDQSWNGGAARQIWGRPPIPGQSTDSPQTTQENDDGKDNQSATSAPNDTTGSTQKPADATNNGDQFAPQTRPREATTNANDEAHEPNIQAEPDVLDFGTAGDLYGVGNGIGQGSKPAEARNSERTDKSFEKQQLADQPKELTPQLPTAQELTYITRALEYLDKAARDPANGGLEQGGSLNAKTGEAHSAKPGVDHATTPMYKGTTDVVMTHLSSILNNPGFRNSWKPEENDYKNATDSNVRMWAINKDGNVFMFDPKTQHVYEWLKGNKSTTPNYDLGVRAASANFPKKYEAAGSST